MIALVPIVCGVFNSKFISSLMRVQERSKVVRLRPNVSERSVTLRALPGSQPQEEGIASLHTAAEDSPGVPNAGGPLWVDPPRLHGALRRRVHRDLALRGLHALRVGGRRHLVLLRLYGRQER